jgi:lipid-binding SYLF domain-containing protein
MFAMRIRFRSVVLVALALVVSPFSAHADEKRAELEQEVKEAVALFKKTDTSIAKLFDSAAGYAVFPKVAKGALGIGAARGRGQLFEKGGVVGGTWLTQVTIGLQAGGQVYCEVIFFENETTLKGFKEGDFKFSAQVSAVAAAEGVAKNAKYEHGVAVFTLAKGGLMYEASVGGQKFDYEPYSR